MKDGVPKNKKKVSDVTEPSAASVPDKGKAGKAPGGAKVAKSGGTDSGD